MSTVSPDTTPGTQIETSLTPQAVAAVAAVMQPTVTDLIDLALTGKQLHWAVVGPRFKPVHEHLDELIEEYREYSDTVAEYLSTIGVVPDGRAVRVAGDTPMDPVDATFMTDDAVIDLMTARIKGVATSLRQRSAQVADADSAAEDLLIEITRVLDKQLWMTSAQR
ncbi:Dps family protein [Euzebya tangerina]|uniref:Dps family protein n=1 Tax=Euzebya tangerina TaxID=591198 RepID=UPI000E319023|nr:DNA starvation/stationary phase protection protein [Euzebya tangerina]